jgi:hypothetical protein
MNGVISGVAGTEVWSSDVHNRKRTRFDHIVRRGKDTSCNLRRSHRTAYSSGKRFGNDSSLTLPNSRKLKRFVRLRSNHRFLLALGWSHPERALCPFFDTASSTTEEAACHQPVKSWTGSFEEPFLKGLLVTVVRETTLTFWCHRERFSTLIDVSDVEVGSTHGDVSCQHD